MIYLINFLLMLVLVFFSISFLPSLRILDATPLIPIFFVIALSYFRKGFEPLLLAAFSGIIFDFISPYTFGFYTFLFLGSVLMVRIMFQEGMKELGFLNYILWCSVIIVVYTIVQIVLLYIEKIEIDVSILEPTITTLITNILSALLLYFGLVWYFDKIKTVENVLKRR